MEMFLLKLNRKYKSLNLHLLMYNHIPVTIDAIIAGIQRYSHIVSINLLFIAPYATIDVARS